MTYPSIEPRPLVSSRTGLSIIFTMVFCLSVAVAALLYVNYVMRDTFCGFVQPVAAAGSPPNPPPLTPTGVAIINGANSTATKLRCPEMSK